MRNLLVFGALVAAASAAPAFAQEVTVSGNVAITTDYAWRNVTQSNMDLAIQGGFDVDFGTGLSVGTWASTVDFGDASDTNVEVDFYGAYALPVSEFDLSIGAIYYAYPDSSGTDLDFYEVNIAAGKEFDGGFSLGGSVNYDPDHETLYADISAAFPVSDMFSIDAGYGALVDEGDGFLGGDYTGFNVGGTLSLHGLDFDVRYYDNDRTGSEDNVIFTIAKSM